MQDYDRLFNSVIQAIAPEACRAMAGGTPDQIDFTIRVIKRLVCSDRPELQHWGNALALRCAAVYSRNPHGFIEHISNVRRKEKRDA